MNNALHDDQFDAEGKSRSPFARVNVNYALDLQRNSAAFRADAERAAEPKPRSAADSNRHSPQRWRLHHLSAPPRRRRPKKACRASREEQPGRKRRGNPAYPKAAAGKPRRDI